MRLYSIGLAVSVAVIGGAALAPAATAESITTSSSCYVIPVPQPNAVQTQLQIPVTGAGWKPGALVGIGAMNLGRVLDYINPTGGSFEGQSATAAADGSFSTEVTVATVTGAPFVKRITIIAGDGPEDPGARDTPTIATRAAGTTGNGLLAQQMTTWKASGFPAGKLYAHFVHGGHAFFTLYLGRSSGPCSLVRRRAHPYPLHGPKVSSFSVIVNGSRRYSPGTRPSVKAFDGVF